MISQSNDTNVGKRKFTKEEDCKLIELVEKYGTDQWSVIARNMNDRNGRQCRVRWKKYLSPDIDNRPWSREEDDLLLEKVKILGSQWANISTFFPKRTDINIKHRYRLLLRKKDKRKESNDSSSSGTEISQNQGKTTVSTSKKPQLPSIFKDFPFDFKFYPPR